MLEVLIFQTLSTGSTGSTGSQFQKKIKVFIKKFKKYFKMVIEILNYILIPLFVCLYSL